MDPASVTKRGEPKARSYVPKRRGPATMAEGGESNGRPCPIEGPGNGGQKRLDKGKAICTQEKGAVNGDHKRQFKGVTTGTQEKGSSKGNQSELNGRP